MPSATDTPTRDRILYASAELFRRQGYAGTGLKQIATEARAPFGSLYHFFPGGKEQLADDVLRTGGRFFLALYEAIAGAAPDFPPRSATSLPAPRRRSRRPTSRTRARSRPSPARSRARTRSSARPPRTCSGRGWPRWRETRCGRASRRNAAGRWR